MSSLTRKQRADRLRPIVKKAVDESSWRQVAVASDVSVGALQNYILGRKKDGSELRGPPGTPGEANMKKLEAWERANRSKAQHIVTEQRAEIVAFDRWDGSVIPGMSVAEVERLLKEQVTDPNLLRRQSRTPMGEDMIVAVKSFVVKLDLTERQKNAVDAYLNRIHAEAKGDRRT